MTTKFLSGSPEKNSESQTRPNLKLIVYAIAGICLAAIGVNAFFGTVGTPDVLPGTIQAAPVDATIQPSLVVTIVVTATPDPTLTPSPTPHIVYLQQQVPVTVTQVVTQEVVNTVYVQQPPVEKLIEVYITPVATPLPDDTVVICVYASGVKALYLNDTGIAGNSCHTYSHPAPISDYHLKVDN